MFSICWHDNPARQHGRNYSERRMDCRVSEGRSALNLSGKFIEANFLFLVSF